MKTSKKTSIVPAVEGSETVKKAKTAKKQKTAPVEIAPMGDTIEKINKACDARKLSEGSRRSAVSMLNTMIKLYGHIPTVDEVEKGAPNTKVKGNHKWLLKLIA